MIRLFLTFLKIGAISFGGGYAVIAMVQQEIVEKYGIITSQQFLDLVALSEMSPGPLAVNASTFVGFNSLGILGAAVSTLGVVLVPILLSLVISAYFNNNGESRIMRGVLYGIRPCVASIILVAVIKLVPMSIVDIYSIIIAAIIAAIYYFKKYSPITLIVLGGMLGYLIYGIILPLIA